MQEPYLLIFSGLWRREEYLHTDHLGSASYITDEMANVVQQIAYLPYGEEWIDIRSNGYFGSAYKFNGKEKDDETGYNYYGARYYTDRLSIWLSVDPMSDQRSWVSPYSYCQNKPLNRIDPTGALDWIPPSDGSGNWTAEAGDSPGSLARDAHITQSKAEAAVKSANQARGQARTSETMVYPGDKVNVASRPGQTWHSGASTTNFSTPNTPSTNSNTSGNLGNSMHTVNNVNTAVGIAISATEQTIKNTQIGANFAYAISGNIKVVNVVNNTFKYAPYAGLGVAVLAGGYLSTQINPATNKPYQSWAVTGADIGVNIATILYRK